MQSATRRQPDAAQIDFCPHPHPAPGSLFQCPPLAKLLCPLCPLCPNSRKPCAAMNSVGTLHPKSGCFHCAHCAQLRGHGRPRRYPDFLLPRASPAVFLQWASWAQRPRNRFTTDCIKTDPGGESRPLEGMYRAFLRARLSHCRQPHRLVLTFHFGHTLRHFGISLPAICTNT